MKRKISIIIIALLLSAIGSNSAKAQEENSGQLWFCWEATVHPEMQSQFIDLQVDFHSKFKENGFPYSIYTWTDRNYGFYFFYPVDSYDDKSGIYDALRAIIPAWGEENFSRMWETLMSHRNYFLQTIPEISYTPEKQRLTDSDMPYAMWDIIYLKPGKEQEFVEQMKLFSALQMANNIEDPVMMLTGDVGYEGSVYIGALKGKDAVDFRLQNKKMWEKVGEKGVAIFKNFESLLRKRESKEFWYSEKLSYIPE